MASNAQIKVPTKPKSAPIKKQGNTKGTKYGQNPGTKPSGK